MRSLPSRETRIWYELPFSGEVIFGGSPASWPPPWQSGNGGGVRRAMPAWANTRARSDGQYSYTSVRVRPGSYGGQAGFPVSLSTTMGRWTLLTRIGDLPGMNHVLPICGHHALGRSPLARQIGTRRRLGGLRRIGSASPGRSARRESAMRKNKGAAASTPTKAGLPEPSKLPIHTTSTYGPKLPAVHASRKLHEVPVFQ